MAAMVQFTAGATLSAADLNDIIDHLQGGSGEDDAYHFRASSGNDFLITLSDAAGSRKFSIRDSGAVEIFAIDSNGNLTLSGTFTQASFLFPTGATPTPMTEGEAKWDTDDDLLAVGDSSGTKIIIPTPTTTIGDMEFADGARSHARVAIGVAGDVWAVNSGATAPEWVAGAGWIFAGSNTSEQTTTSTDDTDVVTVSSLSIAATQPIMIVGNYRKTSGNASTASLGLKLNATQIWTSTGGTVAALTSGTDQAEDGQFVVILPGRATNYVTGGWVQHHTQVSSSGAAARAFTTVVVKDAAMPTVTITSVVVTGRVTSASNTLAVKNVQVYAGRAS